MAQTFSEIIFPPIKKPAIHHIVAPSLVMSAKILDYWFRQIHDHVDHSAKAIVMVKCPACGNVYELMEIKLDRIDHIRKCMREHETYYYNYSRIKCTQCKGVLVG